MNPDYPPKPPDGGPFSPIDLDHIPTRPSRHRRAHSDTFFPFPDDFLFDTSDLDLSAAFAITASDAPMAVDSCSSRPPPPIGHLRSLSMDADFFEGLSFGAASGDNGGNSDPVALPSPTGENRAGFHWRNKSMDGSSSSLESDSILDGVKKSITGEKLAELALIDPKRARRILANRQSAARSKERRVLHAGELERKVQTLQTEATTLSAQVTVLQRGTTGLTSENRELKLRLEALEQQAQLKDALNETLREEVQRLRIETGQIPSTNGSAPNRSSSSPFTGQQTQQPRFQMPQPSSSPFGVQQPQFHMPHSNSNLFGGQQTQQSQFYMPQQSSNDPNPFKLFQPSSFNPRR